MLKPVLSGAEFCICNCVGFTCRTLLSARLAFQFATFNFSCVCFTCRTLVSARLAFEYQWQLFAHVHLVLLGNVFQDIIILAVSRGEEKSVSGHTVRDAQSITNACVRDA